MTFETAWKMSVMGIFRQPNSDRQVQERNSDQVLSIRDRDCHRPIAVIVRKPIVIYPEVQTARRRSDALEVTANLEWRPVAYPSDQRVAGKVLSWKGPTMNRRIGITRCACTVRASRRVVV